MDAIAGQAQGNDDGDGESLILHGVEQGTPIADDLPESKNISIHIIQVNREKLPGGVVFDCERVGAVSQ